MRKILFILFLCLANAITVKAQPQSLWQGMPFTFNNIPSVTAAIPSPSVMYYDSTENACYIAGYFGKIGNVPCNILKWDGSTFTLLPSSPLNVTNCIIRYNGKLYVGGYGFPVNLACWDGQSWQSLDSNSGGADIECFLPYHGKLLVGGNFDNIGNSGISTIAAWDGSSWSSVYGADTFLSNSGWVVSSAMEYKNELYISGKFDIITPLNINEIARFDGTQWTDVGHFQDDAVMDNVRKLLVWKDTLYAAGSFEEASGSPGNCIAKWDGNNWHRLNNGVWQPEAPAITDLMVFNDELYACGFFSTVDGINQGVGFHGFAKWDGRRWCTLGTTANNLPFTMGRFGDSLFLMGTFDSLNNQPMRYMAKWIGGNYTDKCSQPDTTTGVAGHPAIVRNVLSVFPNPATGLLNIRFQSAFSQPEPADVLVTDVTGQVVQNKVIRINPGDNFYRLNISRLVPGMYFLEIRNRQKNMVAKFIRQ